MVWKSRDDKLDECDGLTPDRKLTRSAFLATMFAKGKCGEKFSPWCTGEAFSYAARRYDGDETDFLHYDSHLLSE